MVQDQALKVVKEVERIFSALFPFRLDPHATLYYDSPIFPSPRLDVEKYFRVQFHLCSSLRFLIWECSYIVKPKLSCFLFSSKRNSPESVNKMSVARGCVGIYGQAQFC